MSCVAQAKMKQRISKSSDVTLPPVNSRPRPSVIEEEAVEEKQSQNKACQAQPAVAPVIVATRRKKNSYDRRASQARKVLLQRRKNKKAGQKKKAIANYQNLEAQLLEVRALHVTKAERAKMPVRKVSCVYLNR